MDFQSNSIIKKGMRKLTIIMVSVLVLEIAAFVGVSFLIGADYAVLLMLGFLVLGVSIKPLANPGQKLTIMNSTRQLAAILFILPGFLTDILGLVILIGPVRRALLSYVMRKVVPPTFLEQFKPADEGRFNNFMSDFADQARQSAEQKGRSKTRKYNPRASDGDVIDIDDYEIRKDDSDDLSRVNPSPKALVSDDDVIDVEHEWKS